MSGRITRAKKRADDLERTRASNNPLRNLCCSTDMNNGILMQLDSFEQARNFMLACAYSPEQVRSFWLSAAGERFFQAVSCVPKTVQQLPMMLCDLGNLQVDYNGLPGEPEATEIVKLYALRSGTSTPVLIVTGTSSENVCEPGCWCASRTWRSIFTVVPGHPPQQMLVRNSDDGAAEMMAGGGGCCWIAPLKLFAEMQQALSVTPEVCVSAINMIGSLDPKSNLNIASHSEEVTPPLEEMRRILGPRDRTTGPSCRNAMTFTLEVIQELHIQNSEGSLLELSRLLQNNEWTWNDRVAEKIALHDKRQQREHVAMHGDYVPFNPGPACVIC